MRYTFRTGRHKRQADIILLFQYIWKRVSNSAGVDTAYSRVQNSPRKEAQCLLYVSD